MGYLIIDNSVSGGSKNEYDTQACPHCQAVIDKKKWREDGGILCCSRCKKPLCHACSAPYAKTLECETWEQMIDRRIKEANQMVQILGELQSKKS